MKGKQVSALRERGLRRRCGAEPQRCEPQFKGQFKQPERKTDTMKTYLLKNACTVEPKPAPQKRPPPPPWPAFPRNPQPRMEASAGRDLFSGMMCTMMPAPSPWRRAIPPRCAASFAAITSHQPTAPSPIDDKAPAQRGASFRSCLDYWGPARWSESEACFARYDRLVFGHPKILRVCPNERIGGVFSRQRQARVLSWSLEQQRV
jgi:hypothetical protein